jgi:hypothetical protein
MSDVTILHLSDLHFGGDWGEQQRAERATVLSHLLDFVVRLQSPWKPHCICISGDIAYRGSKSDYKEAEFWIGELLSRLGLTAVDLVVCAGNHDVCRDVAERFARPNSADEADSILKYPIAEHSCAPFAEYSAFCKRFGIPPLKIGSDESFLVGQRQLLGVRFIVANSSWFCKDNDDKGKLWVGLPQLRFMEGKDQMPLLSEGGDFMPTVALLHHPHEWLRDEEIHSFANRQNTLDYVAHRCHLLLTGHTHGELRRADRRAEFAWHIMAGATYENASHFNCFRLIRLEEDQIVYRSFEFDPRSASVCWKESFGARELPFSTRTSTGSLATPHRVPLDIVPIRAAAKRDAEATMVAKSRQIRPRGELPSILELQVSTRVTKQTVEFDQDRQLITAKSSESQMALMEACRLSRRTMLLGDLGSGKSTLAGQFVLDTLNQNKQCVAFLIPVKNLRLTDRFMVDELLKAMDDYVFGQIAPNVKDLGLQRLLESRIELSIVFDGLDELSRELAPHFVRQAAALVDLWPNFQILATGRPVELAGISYDQWELCRTVGLLDHAKREIFQREAVADGYTPEDAISVARSKFAILKNHPTLDSLANTPLAVRLICTKLSSLEEGKEVSLGGLLADLLIERLGGWDARDLKSFSSVSFQSSFPTPEEKASLLGSLALQHSTPDRQIDYHHARQILVDACIARGLQSKQIADEALSFFQQAGIVTSDSSIEFVFQPLKEVSGAFALVESWIGPHRNTSSTDRPSWRCVSFAAAIARRNGKIALVRNVLMSYASELLATENGIAPTCYVISESDDSALAIDAIDRFEGLSRRPLMWAQEERFASSRAIATTIALAGKRGFDWLYASYLDPRYPIINRGSAIICSVFRHWASMVKGTLDEDQKSRLSKLVDSYLAHGGLLSEFLNNLVVLVPNSFDLKSRLWLLSGTLGDSLFGVHAENTIRESFRNGCQSTVNAILLRRSSRSLNAALLYMDLNPGRPPIEVVSTLIDSAARYPDDTSSAKARSRCQETIGEESWKALLRWSLTDSNNDSRTSTGAALLLHELGEVSLSVIGGPLVMGLHDGGYVRRAEVVLSTLLKGEGERGVRWLANQILSSEDRMHGAHSGLWRLLLDRIAMLPDEGSKIVGSCMKAVGPFLMARCPEIRHSFRLFLEEERNRTSLRKRLWDVDPAVRFGSAMVLSAVDPQNESEAVYVAIKSRPATKMLGYHEWESFFLTLSFGPSVLSFLHVNLKSLNSYSRGLALAILSKHGVALSPEEHHSLEEEKLQINNWNLRATANYLNVDASTQEFTELLLHLDRPYGERSGNAAQQLLARHSDKLSSEQEAKCWIVGSTKQMFSAESLLYQLLRMCRDKDYRNSIVEQTSLMQDEIPEEPLLALGAAAIVNAKKWKDLIWKVLCDDTQIRIDPEDYGEAILEFGRQETAHSEALGKAAIEILDDPRIQRERWTDAYHWVALIADEFCGLQRGQLETVLLCGAPIHGSATRALISRLGYVPENLPKRHEMLDESELHSTSTRLPTKQDLTAQLIECARTSERLHPQTCETIRDALFSEPFTSKELESINNAGDSGAIIAEVLRFCFRLPPSFRSRVRLLRRPWLTPEQAQDKCLQRLRLIANMANEESISSDSERREEYLDELAEELKSNGTWPIPIALELLFVRGNLLADQVAKVIRSYSENHGVLHDVLSQAIVKWLISESAYADRDTIVCAAMEGIQLLDQTSWDSGSTGIRYSAFPYLVLPLAVWSFTSKSTDECDRVFLRGIKFIYMEAYHGFTGNPISAFAIIEPLIAKAPREILRSVLEKASAYPDPSVRAFVTLTRLASFGE